MTDVVARRRVPRAVYRANVRDRLLAAAARLVAAGEPFATLSVERLVTEAGVSRSTFYHHFEDKGDLLRSIFAHVDAGFADALSEWLDDAPPPTQDALRARLVSLGRAVATAPEGAGALIGLRAYDAAVRDALAAARESLARRIAEHARGARAGEDDPQVAEVAAWLSCLLERTWEGLLRGDRAADAHITALAALLWRVLYAD
jgi:AcrR family transcriptional regulator